MLVQDYLCSGKTLADLGTEYGIKAVEHPEDPLVILNYCQITSPKTEPLVHECRALTLHKDSWEVVARSFQRFFNYGEMAEITSRFNWQDYEATAKEDGSLMVLYHYAGQWRVNTRGSFAALPICTGGPTWGQLFFGTLGDKLHLLDPQVCYVFEMCSQWNKVVRSYPQPTLFLLAMFYPDGRELWRADVEEAAADLGVQCPQTFTFRDVTEIVSHLNRDDLDATFEGFVLRDDGGMRLKIKNARYVALHTLKGNDGNLFMTKNLLPFVLKGERDELLAYFPEVKDRYEEVDGKVRCLREEMMTAWESAKGIESQKDFALTIIPRTKLSSVLFEARRKGVTPDDLWREKEDLLLKVLDQPTP
jgi:hypothetical protein